MDNTITTSKSSCSNGDSQPNAKRSKGSDSEPKDETSCLETENCNPQHPTLSSSSSSSAKDKVDLPLIVTPVHSSQPTNRKKKDGSKSCAICLSEDGETRDGITINILANHNCPVCVSGAWDVCEVCDENLLSRTCPVCNSDYAPMVLYVVNDLPNIPPTPEDMANPSYTEKISAIGMLITRSNTTVWCPETNKMHFFLPQDFSASEDGFGSMTVAIDMSADQIVDGQFLFTNKVWDELIRVMEEGQSSSETSQEILSTHLTMKNVFRLLCSPGAKLLTKCPPEDADMIFGGGN